jgi:hypothetical protein
MMARIDTAGYRWLVAAGLLALLAACQSRPQIRTQTAPALDILKYQTYGFVEHPDTDKAGYTTLTTRYLKDAVNREMLARGYALSEKPDLLVNFSVANKDKVEGTTGSSFGVGYGGGWGGWGGWGRRGVGVGVGIGDRDIRTVTEGSLTIDVVDHQRSELIWSGTAAGRLTQKALNDPQPAIDKAVGLIFAKYPKQPLVAAAVKSK